MIITRFIGAMALSWLGTESLLAYGHEAWRVAAGPVRVRYAARGY
jgi:hypothetical protein